MCKSKSFNNENSLKSFINSKLKDIYVNFDDIVINNRTISPSLSMSISLKQLADDLISIRINGVSVDSYASVADIFYFISRTLLGIVDNIVKDKKIVDGLVRKSDIDFECFVECIVKKFIVAPYDFTYVYTMPAVKEEIIDPIPLSDDVYIKSDDLSNVHGNGIFSSLLHTFDIPEPRDGDNKCMPCLFVKVRGLSGEFDSAYMSGKADAVFKQILITAHILNLVDIKKYSYIVNNAYDGSVMQLLKGCGIDNRKCNMRYVIRYALQNSAISDHGLLLLKNISDRKNENVNDKLESLKNVLDSKKEEFKRIRASTEWLFEAFFTENETSSFIFTSLAIEALLGGKITSKNTKEVMASRFAYSISKSYQDRENVYNKYKDFYDKRSYIVHGSEAKISDVDQEVLYFVREKFIALLGDMLAENSDSKKRINVGNK